MVYTGMVKVEDCEESSEAAAAAVAVAVAPADIMDQKPLPALSSALQPISRPVALRPISGPVVVKEESFASSSSGHLRSYFISMGFLPTLVDKVIKENGQNDAELILDALMTHSALQKSSPRSSSSLGGFSSPDIEEDGIHVDSLPNCKEEPEEHFDTARDKKSYLLEMNFSQKEIDFAIHQLGENASLAQLADYIVTIQAGGFAEEKEIIGKDEGNSDEKLFGMMDKTLCLLQMGFTEEEVSSAIDNFGPEVSVLELADSIFASRMAHNKEQDVGYGTSSIKRECDYMDNGTTDYPGHYTSSWDANFDDYEDKARIKKAKHVMVDDKTASSSINRPQSNWDKPNPYGIKEETPGFISTYPRRHAQGLAPNVPYFFYGNAVDISKDTWRKLSQFLYGTEPEFVNTQFFSALIRKEGYIHNLPTERRCHILPKPPMTIEDAIPHTKKWWPSWDTRKQLSCINSETDGVSLICEQLGKMVMDSHGMLSREQQANVLHQCKTLNLIWVGEDKLSPIEPHQLERILGYPLNHTRLWGLEAVDRLKALKYCFQIDTVGYLLSVLKGIFPDGIRVLSVYSGIGGIEIALHKLGIFVKCLVSVESSEVNRKILRRWWNNTEQPGELRQVAGIGKLTIQRLEDFIREFGGFDIVVGGNPGTSVSQSPSGHSTLNTAMGMDSNLFFEFVRVLQRVRSIMGSRNN
ncbi:DNA (cytosine-5)-methyltransferase DRM2 [Ananas comosus]|uniref:DNA (cytosine-5-)-methyltransferase n=1 Tax=Ananas comosus TaxID=4615 RepID=A0A199V7E4_ANACO|nr:DNA (cytosine-5)-methyltransferase DRM2 [Ananas comosus]